ncbi:MAG: BTAD domain-containing putative transcriptional regulator [Anaerolineaceae bacterium]
MSTEISRLIEESRALERGGRIPAAIHRAVRARQLAQAGNDTESEATALNALAYAHIRLGHYPQAVAFSQEALALAGPESRARAEALLNINICASETNDLDTGEKYLLQAIDLARQIGDERSLVRGLHSISCGIYMPRGQFALSLAADEEAANIIRFSGLMELMWGPILTMSWVYWLTGQYRLAAVRLDELRAILLPNSLADGYWHYIHGNLAIESGDFETARSMLQKTRTIAESNGITENLFLAHLGMSRLSRLLNDAPAALGWANEAYRLMERTGYEHLQAQALIEHSRAAWTLGDLPAAEADLRSAINLLTPQRLAFDLAIATLLLAALLNQQNHPQAPALWQEAAARLTQGGFVFLVDRERALTFPLIVQGLKSPDKSVVAASNSLLKHLYRVPPPPLEITTLGGWRLKAGGHSIDPRSLRQRRAGELLGLLLISPGRLLLIDQIIDTLWPEKDFNAAQSLLHQATSTLRRALEPDLPEKFSSRYLRVDDGSITLVLPPDSQVDYETFLSHIRRADWDAALACHPGEFLPEYRYADWAEAHRRWLAQDYQRALLAKARIWLSEKQFLPALDACRKLLAAEPWQEQAALLGMQACIGLGDTAGALRLYRTLEKALHTDLGVEPQPELQTLYCSLLNR